VYSEWGLTWIKILDKYIGDIDSFIGNIDKIVTYWFWLDWWWFIILVTRWHDYPTYAILNLWERGAWRQWSQNDQKGGASFAEGSSCIFFYKCIKVNTYEASGLIHWRLWSLSHAPLGRWYRNHMNQAWNQVYCKDTDTVYSFTTEPTPSIQLYTRHNKQGKHFRYSTKHTSISFPWKTNCLTPISGHLPQTELLHHRQPQIMCLRRPATRTWPLPRNGRPNPELLPLVRQLHS
jgi:hypothetical protein